jgi:hypothetical protein
MEGSPLDERDEPAEVRRLIGGKTRLVGPDRATLAAAVPTTLRGKMSGSSLRLAELPYEGA